MVRRCLVDADVLCYELGFASETAWRGMGHEGLPPWALVEQMLERRIDSIEFECEATLPSRMYFTGKGNFRYEIAKRTPYKDRAGIKPFHYGNIKLYLLSNYDSELRDGLEADDLISIECTAHPDTTIICTRDKDLRQVSGWHYGWELGKQPGFGPKLVSGYGAITISDDRKKLSGYGLKFFLAQCITGDGVDSVPGLPRGGPALAYDSLKDTTTYKEGLEVVQQLYAGKFTDLTWEDELREQGRLLWMTRQLNKDGSPVLWNVWEDYEE